MEAYRHAHHAHARRSHLTKLYDDTKKSASITVNPTATEHFPDLRRKFRIQNDRLITWGLDWSDGERKAGGDIGDAVAKAGLTETVDSVLRNIKEVTEEAERIQQASLTHGLGLGGEKVAISPKPAVFDQARYEDLLQDLTTSIDTLYDLTRSRTALARGEHPWTKSPATETPSNDTQKSTSFRRSLHRTPSFASSSLTLVNPTSFSRPALSPYAGLPPSIEISSLRLPEEGPPPYESLGVPSTTRLVAKLIRARTSEGVQNRMGSNAAEVPVLVEYANFDSVYRDTHVPPPLQRLESLAAYLQPMRPDSQMNLSLLGYFEDPSQPRIGLVYDVPYAIQNKLQGNAHSAAQTLAPTSLLKLVQKANKTPSASGEFGVPPLEDRFRVALRLAEQLADLHSSEIAHGNINSNSIIFTKTSEEPASASIRTPLWAAFDLFSKCNVEGTRRAINLNIYRSPADEPHDPNRVLADDIKFDMYSFALVLLEIGLWTPIGDCYKAKYTLSDFRLRLEKIWIPKLAQKCGSAYMRAVQACFHMADGMHATKPTLDSLYIPLLSRLRRCCLLEDEGPYVEPTSASSSFTQTSVAPTSTRQSSFSQSSYAQSTVLPSTGKIARKPVPSSRDPSPLPRQLSDPDELLRSQTMPSITTTTTPYRLNSLPNLAAASVPMAYAGMSPSARPELSRKPSTRSQMSRRSSISQMRQRVSDRFTSQPSFKDYKRKVTIIQQAWRERSARKRELAREPVKNEGFRTIPEDAEDLHASGKRTKPVRQAFPSLQVPQEVVEMWYKDAGPRLAKLCEKALKGSKESASIAVAMYGETVETARPTYLVTCKSTAKVKQMLKKHFQHDPSLCCLRVKKTMEEIRYARRAMRHGESAARRTMAPSSIGDHAANPDYQERPLCGASIGAYREEEHLPPVSLGGVILVDGTAYGMSVHHMLEPPDDEEEEEEDDAESGADDDSETSSIGSIESHSDDESTVRPPSTLPDTEESDELYEGDIPGITPDDFEEVDITQPALDDAIECDLHVDVDTEDDDSGIDEDHLMSYKLGQIFASSGLKRSAAASSHEEGFRSVGQSLPQEIDWALFELVPPRVHPFNIVRGGGKYCANSNTHGNTFPTAIRKSSELACAPVHCIGRTSGLASGMTSSTMEVVKIRGRSTFSASWTVSGDFGAGGDSGAWVISNEDGRVCGHVLASKTGRTYICPMELLLDDIRTTLNATTVVLPTIERAEIGRVSKSEAEQAVVDAVSQLRLADSETGGVALPASPPRRSMRRNMFARTPEAVETAG